jgi:hypothetical protein
MWRTTTRNAPHLWSLPRFRVVCSCSGIENLSSETHFDFDCGAPSLGGGGTPQLGGELPPVVPMPTVVPIPLCQLGPVTGGEYLGL